MKQATGRITKQRTFVLKTLKQKDGPISAVDLLKLAKTKIPDINKTTIYRVLERLVQEELVEAVNIKAGIVHYELAHEKHHHHHFVCNACSKVSCIEGCPAELKSLVPKGFLMTSHDLTLRGICPSCR